MTKDDRRKMMRDAHERLKETQALLSSVSSSLSNDEEMEEVSYLNGSDTREKVFNELDSDIEDALYTLNKLIDAEPGMKLQEVA